MDIGELSLGDEGIWASPLGRDQDREHGEDSPCLCLRKEDQSFLHREKLPYSRAGLLMEKSSGYVKISIRLVLTFLWNEEDSALVRTFTYSILPLILRRS